MAAQAKNPATYAEIEALPEHLVGEILFGNLVTYPRPHRRHGGAATSLTDEVVGPFQKGRGGPGGWIFVAEPELRLGPHFTSPDIAGWPRAHDRAGRQSLLRDTTRLDLRGALGSKREVRQGRQAAHLCHLRRAVSVASRSARTDARGVPPHGESWLLTHTFVDTEDVCAPPFDAITFPLGLLWPFDPPSDSSTSEPVA